MQKVYLNGEFLPAAEARVSVMDRGFLFGDGVYEVIPCYAGRMFRLQHHLQRLENSLRGIRMENPLTFDQWRQMLDELIAQLPGQDQSIYLQVTRGSSGKRDHAIPKQISPTVFAMTNPAQYADPALAEKGIEAVTLEDNRWQRCNIKAITLLANVLLRSEAVDAGAAEAILVRDGQATEGAASNLFVVKEGVVVTPPNGPQLLPGITRDLVLELAAANDMAFEEREIPESLLFSADEVWLTSSTKEVMPVVRLNGKPVADGRPGRVFQQMNKLYAAYKARLQAGTVTE
jgi:D-alanine transaminase